MGLVANIMYIPWSIVHYYFQFEGTVPVVELYIQIENEGFFKVYYNVSIVNMTKAAFVVYYHSFII